MPTSPASLKQLAFVRVKARRGADWAKKTVGEWHGKTFGKLPLRVRRGKKPIK